MPLNQHAKEQKRENYNIIGRKGQTINNFLIIKPLEKSNDRRTRETFIFSFIKTEELN